MYIYTHMYVYICIYIYIPIYRYRVKPLYPYAQIDHFPISIALFEPQTIVHAIPLGCYSSALNRPPP